MKKFSKCMALFATLSLLSSLFFSCKQEPDDPVVTEISVFLEEQGKIFVEGDTLSKDDVVVTALYSNGKTRNVTNRAKITPELPKTLSESFTLKAEYDEKTADLKIEVGKKDDYYKNEAGEYIKLKEISLALKESNKEFFEGDAISKDDFVVTAKYEDDTTKEVKEADGVTFEGITDEKLIVGKVTIKATFGSQSKSLDITVHAKGAKVESISIALKAGKTYGVGDTISKDDFIVTAKFSDGTTGDVTSKAQFTGLGKTTAAGKVTITATYESKTGSCEVTVQAKTLTSISLSLKQSGKTFSVGDTISASDFIVTATYNNNTTEDVTGKAQFTGLEGATTKAGKVKITATYEAKTSTIEITVHSKDATVESILLERNDPSKTYVVGDIIPNSDFKVTAIYSDGLEDDVTNEAEFDGLGKLEKAGEVAITATYSSKTASITVKVLISKMLYINIETDGRWVWESMQVEKEGGCFYYEFERTGIMKFGICARMDWNRLVFGGVPIPQTGAYVAPNLAVDLIYTEDATVYIANSGDRIYIRYENENYYVRYAAKGEIVNPNEEMEIVESILFDIGFDDVDKIGLKYFPEYMLEGERFNVGVVEDSESTPCTYEYQWYKNGEKVVGATSNDSPNFEEGYFYYCVVTATARDNPRNIVKKKSPEFYICNKDMNDVSLSSNKITLTNATKTEDLWVTSPYCDSIEWEVSDPFVLSLDGYNDIGGHKTYNVSIRALMNGDSTITVTMTRRGEKKSVTCDVTVSGLSVVEEEYSWWYYVLDTSKASNLQSVGLIFNDGKSSQTKDIKNVQSTGEIFYKWNGASRTVLAKIDKSKVDESILQTGIDTEKKLVVYVSVPTRVSSVYLHTWDMYISGGFTFTGEQWPGVSMKKCTASTENSTGGETTDGETTSGGFTTE